MPSVNQDLVRRLLRASPRGLSEKDLKRSFRGKNFKKIVGPMISCGEVLVSLAKVYTLNTSYIPATAIRRPRKSPFRSRLVLLELSRHHGLTLDPSGLAELTGVNSGIVETLIPVGLRQHGTGRLLAKIYIQTAEVKFLSLKRANRGVFNFSSYADVYDVVCAIDKDNSTQDLRFHRGVACDFITRYINNPANDFVNKIDSASTPIIAKALVDDIRTKMVRAGLYDARSLASKVCKYMSEYNSGGRADVFYIDDQFVREAIPYYMDSLFGLRIPKPTVDASSYSELYDWLSRIHSIPSARGLTKSQLDHLLWYIYRK